MRPQETRTQFPAVRRLVIVMLRTTLVVLFFGAVLSQVLVPIAAAEIGRLNPEVAHLVLPYSLAAIFVIACGEVVLVTFERLLTLLADGVLVTERALRLVDVAMVGAGLATASAAGVAVYLGGFAEVNGGGLPLMILGGVALGAALTLGLALARVELMASVARRAVVRTPHDMT